jgi:TldD protein
VRVSLTVIVEEGGRREQGHAGGGGRCDYGYFTDAMLESYVAQAVGQALLNLDARDAPAGTMTVVLGHGWPGILLHEAIGHGLEGDFNRKGTSAFSGRVGQRVAAPGITVIDDGTIDRAARLAQCRRRRPSDAAQRADRGWHPQVLHAGSPQCAADGRRADGQWPPRIVRAHADAADDEHDHAGRHARSREIIASVDDGLYAANFGGGQVDITSGKFVFSAAEAWKIEHGKLTYRSRGRR